METYSLNKLIEKLSTEIFDMEMPGFDSNCDYSWTGEGDFNIEFEDCIVAVECTIEKSFLDDKESEIRTVYINKIWIQLPDKEKLLTVEEIKTIEESLKL